MISKLKLSLIAMLMFSLPVQAQFGPAHETPPNSDEIFADRAMRDAAALQSGRRGDIVTADDGVDLEQAGRWHERAREKYTSLCADRTLPRDAWARNCFKLANMSRRGLGFRQDYEYAEVLFREACVDGQHTPSCLQQAYIDHTGATGRTDWISARALYTIACDRNDPSGCAGLGNMLYRGQGGKSDRARGALLLQSACAEDYEWACERLRGFGIPRRALQ